MLATCQQMREITGLSVKIRHSVTFSAGLSLSSPSAALAGAGALLPRLEFTMVCQITPQTLTTPPRM